MFNLGKLLKQKGIKGKFIADKLNVSPQQLYHHLKKKKDLSLGVAVKVAKILEMSVDELIDKIKD